MLKPQEKRQSLTKKLNEYTASLTPGQTTKLSKDEIRHAYNTYLGRDPFAGENGTVNEYEIYLNHPDDKLLRKDLSTTKKRNDKILKQVEDAQKQQQEAQVGQGQGGPMDGFGSNLAQGASTVGQKLSSMLGSVPTTPTSPAANFPVLSGTIKASAGGRGFRTDRNNNPTAMTTDVAAQSGLKPGIDFVAGDPFTGGDGRTYYTARLLGNPVQTTIKALDNGGFYTSSGKPRWTYTSQIGGVDNWSNLNAIQKANIIAQMYKREGGSGSLLNNGAGGPPDGQGGPTDLGNLTTSFGQQTKDTSFHTGIDIANRNGTPIPKLMGTGGRVTSVRQNGDYGNQVVIKNNNGTTETYSHLRRAMVAPGQVVGPNQKIGEMGHTGNSWSSTGGDPSHLHYEVLDAYNRFVNPMGYVQ